VVGWILDYLPPPHVPTCPGALTVPYATRFNVTRLVLPLHAANVIPTICSGVTTNFLTTASTWFLPPDLAFRLLFRLLPVCGCPCRLHRTRSCDYLYTPLYTHTYTRTALPFPQVLPSRRFYAHTAHHRAFTRFHARQPPHHTPTSPFGSGRCGGRIPRLNRLVDRHYRTEHGSGPFLYRLVDFPQLLPPHRTLPIYCRPPRTTFCPPAAPTLHRALFTTATHLHHH